MLSKWIWIFFFGCVIFGMWMIYDQGIKPKSIRVIKVSNFESPVQLGELVYTAMRPRLHMHPLAVVGMQDENQRAMVEAFLRATGYVVVPTLQSDTFKLVISELKSGKKVVVLTTPDQAIHFNKTAKIHELEKISGQEALSFAFVHLPGSNGSVPYEPCVRTGKFTHTIGCLLEDKIKIFKGGRGKLDWQRFVGTMEQEGQRTFMIYTSFP